MNMLFHACTIIPNIMTKILICLFEMQVVMQVACNTENWNKNETELIKSKKNQLFKKKKQQ